MRPQVSASVSRPLTGRRRRMVQRLAFVFCLVIAAIYFLIGLRFIEVIDNPDDQVVFGTIAGVAFVVGGLILLRWDRRWLWVTGTVIQLLIAYVYFDLASQRDPAFEQWGILLRILQIPLVAVPVW